NEVSALHSSIRATGVDISPDRVQEAIQRNRENPRLKFVRGDAQAMQFPSDSFDFVYSRMLLQYLREKEKAVAEMVLEQHSGINEVETECCSNTISATAFSF